MTIKKTGPVKTKAHGRHHSFILEDGSVLFGFEQDGKLLLRRAKGGNAAAVNLTHADVEGLGIMLCRFLEGAKK